MLQASASPVGSHSTSSDRINSSQRRIFTALLDRPGKLQCCQAVSGQGQQTAVSVPVNQADIPLVERMFDHNWRSPLAGRAPLRIVGVCYIAVVQHLHHSSVRARQHTLPHRKRAAARWQRKQWACKVSFTALCLHIPQRRCTTPLHTHHLLLPAHHRNIPPPSPAPKLPLFLHRP